jgi:hypothetical protein
MLGGNFDRRDWFRRERGSWAHKPHLNGRRRAGLLRGYGLTHQFAKCEARDRDHGNQSHRDNSQDQLEPTRRLWAHIIDTGVAQGVLPRNETGT